MTIDGNETAVWDRMPSGIDMVRVLQEEGRLPSGLKLGTLKNNASDLLKRMRVRLSSVLKEKGSIVRRDILDAEELQRMAG